jgi:transcriptional regulator with XRE-family HTH domain
MASSSSSRSAVTACSTEVSSWLTQTALADRLGRRQAYISRIERGERRIDVVEFLDLAHAIGLNPAKLIADFDRSA